MLPDRQEHKAYEYVRTIIETINPDGVPVVFGLRRVPGAVERFTDYLEYLAAGVNATMPHTGELKRAVREAFRQVRNSLVGDGTVPVLDCDLTESQRSVIRSGIERLKVRLPQSTAAFWREVLAKWSRLFLPQKCEDKGNCDEGEEVINADETVYEAYSQWNDDYARQDQWDLRGLWERFAGNIGEKMQSAGTFCLWAAIAFALGFAACRFHIADRIRDAFTKSDAASRQTTTTNPPAQPLVDYKTFINCMNCGTGLDISHINGKNFGISCPACGCQMIVDRK